MRKSQVFPLWTLVALTFSLAMPAQAGVERWTSYGPPEGFLVTLAIDGGRLLAATEESGVYASTDQGLTWFRSSKGLGNERIEALAVDSDDHEIYAAGQHRFFRSVDAGAHWTVVGPLPAQEEPWEGGPVHDVLTLAPGEPDVFFLSIGKILYQSTDGGHAWVPLLTGATDIQSFLVDPNDPRSLFVGTRGPESALLHSPDGGDTWAQVTNIQPAGSPPEPPFSNGVPEIIAAAPSTFFAISGNFHALYRSRDAGATWQEILLPPPGNGAILSVVATSGQRPRIYAFQYNEADPYQAARILFASDDLGDTWVVSTEAARGTSLRVDPATGTLLSFDPGGVGIAEEEGAPWRFSPLGASPSWFSEYRPIPKVRFARGRTYVIVGGRLWESRDGQNWTALGRDLLDQGMFQDLVVDPRPGVLWAATGGGVSRSNDGGTTWTPSLSVSGYRYEALTQLDSHTLLFSGSGIWRSGDRGATWKRTMSAVSPDYQISERYVDRVWAEPGNPKIVYAEVAELLLTHPPEVFGYIYQSLDGGLTWRRLVENVYSLALHPTEPQTLYGFGRGGLLRSRDRGRHWKKISNGFRQYVSDLVVDPSDPRILYAAADGVWRSLDGGITWAPLRLGLDSLPTYQIFPDPRRPGRLFVAGEGFFTGLFALPGD